MGFIRKRWEEIPGELDRELNTAGLEDYRKKRKKSNKKEVKVKPKKTKIDIEVRYDIPVPCNAYRQDIRDFLNNTMVGGSFVLKDLHEMDSFRQIAYRLNMKLTRHKLKNGTFRVWRIK